MLLKCASLIGPFMNQSSREDSTSCNSPSSRDYFEGSVDQPKGKKILVYESTHLHSKFPVKFLEAIKGQRRQAKYNAMVGM